MTSQVPVRFTYQKDGTAPPVYVAGTFSNPSWQPFEMDVSLDENGLYTFSKVIDVSVASDIQYKFRIGSGDWWLCNENAEIGKPLVLITILLPVCYSVATIGINYVLPVQDDQGNLNNILRISSRPSGKTDLEATDSAALFDGGTPEIPGQTGKVDSSPPSESPRGESHEITDSEVPNTAGKLNAGKSAGGDTEPSHPVCPIFSHEHVTIPEEDDAYEETFQPSESSPDDSQLRKNSETRKHEYAQDPDIDLDNPTLERFPSDSASIIATIRRLSTSVDEDRTVPQGAAPSPLVDMKSSTDESSEPQSLAVPQTRQSLADKKKNSLSGSITSLNSIAEADDEAPATGADKDVRDYNEVLGGGVTRHGPATNLHDKGDGPASDDEGIAMCNVARERPAEGNIDGADLMIPEPRDFIRLHHSHIVEPVLQSSTPPLEEDRIDSAEIINPSGLAVNHARAVSPHIVISDSSNQNSLRKVNTDRPASRASINSLHDVKGSTNWLQAFIHVLLVDWVGGFISRLWNRRRTT